MIRLSRMSKLQSLSSRKGRQVMPRISLPLLWLIVPMSAQAFLNIEANGNIESITPSTVSTADLPQSLTSASASRVASSNKIPPPAVLPAFLQSYDNLKAEHAPVVLAAEAMASPTAQKVLKRAHNMALNERAIIQGGCWDYLNTVFRQAGADRQTVFEGTYQSGPYADINTLRSGDWLYYINHGYNDIEHSGLFIGWVDKPNRQALILSYAGEQRREPARYKVYDLSHVYQVMRPVE